MLDGGELNDLSRGIIGCAIEAHRRLGPGLLESIYEDALCLELKHAGFAFIRQMSVPVVYRGEVLSSPLKLDLLVEEEVVVEVKAVETILDVHEAQVVSYLRLCSKRLGLLINFNVPVLKNGIRRKVNRLGKPQ